MTIILIRHGETDLNAARVLQPPDTPLGTNGVAQAAAVARRVATLAPHALISSDLRRAWQTAEAIAAVTGLTIEPEPLLHERNFGDWRGLPWGDLELDPSTHTGTPPNGESPQVFEARVALAWSAVLARRAQLDGPLVVVSHGLVLHRMLSAHVRLADSVLLPAKLHNTALSIVDAEPPHVARLVGDTRHLA
jgi:probable phosphoglycerate mutase